VKEATVAGMRFKGFSIGPAAAMLVIGGLFMILAGLGSLIPSFVKDRGPLQFEPVWRFLMKPVLGESPSDGVMTGLALASQVVIGVVELVIGAVLLAAAALPTRRVTLTSAGVTAGIGLFGVFMLTMFAMHDPTLPKWNQYPAILAWLGVTWLMVVLADGQFAGKERG
jgi:uncharacterized membrane protein YczE